MGLNNVLLQPAKPTHSHQVGEGKCSVVPTCTHLGLAYVLFGVLDLQLQVQSSLLAGR